jgi:hypothetical protein
MAVRQQAVKTKGSKGPKRGKAKAQPRQTKAELGRCMK